MCALKKFQTILTNFAGSNVVHVCARAPDSTDETVSIKCTGFRQRDRSKGCIFCSRHPKGFADASLFIPVNVFNPRL